MWGLNNIMDVVCDLRINKLFTINSYIYMYKHTEVQKFSFLCDLFKDQEVIFMTKVIISHKLITSTKGNFTYNFQCCDFLKRQIFF